MKIMRRDADSAVEDASILSNGSNHVNLDVQGCTRDMVGFNNEP